MSNACFFYRRGICVLLLVMIPSSQLFAETVNLDIDAASVQRLRRRFLEEDRATPVPTTPRPSSGAFPPPTEFPPPTTGGGPVSGLDEDRSILPFPSESQQRLSTLNVDLSFDLPKNRDLSEAEKSSLRMRVRAIVFAINSINTRNRNLLRVSDLLPAIPNRAPVKITIPLQNYLSNAQIRTLRSSLERDPMHCESGDPDAVFRADSIVKNIFDRETYYRLFGLRNLAGRDNEMGLEPYLSASPLERAQMQRTRSFLVPAGQSGVVHRNANRLLVLQEGQGGIAITSGDVFTNEASQPNRNFGVHPVTASPNGYEKIGTLPNGMLSYSLADGAQNLMSDAPRNLVRPEITNPVSCLECHGRYGFIATTGRSGSIHGDRLRRVPIQDEAVQGRPIGRILFRASWQDYSNGIATPNLNYARALETSDGSSGAVTDVLEKYREEVPLDQLAIELGMTSAELRRELGQRAFRENINSSVAGGNPSADGSLPGSLTRTALESEVVVGRNQTKSLYCALKDKLVDETRRRQNTSPFENHREL